MSDVITYSTADLSHDVTVPDAFRAVIVDGSADVLVADRRVDRNAADVRVRAPQRITVRRAANAIAHRAGWTREEVLAFYGVEDSKDIARGALRDRYLSIIG